MRKRTNKKILYIILCIVTISIVTMTLAYAALSSTLIISGAADVTGSSWDISISKVNINEQFPNSIWIQGQYRDRLKHDDNSLIVDNGKLLSSGTISGTSINNIKISLSTPNDAVVATYKVTNNGSIPAILDSVSLNESNTTSSTNNQSDIELVNQYFNYDIILVPTKYITDTGSPTDDATVMEPGDVLCPGDSFYIIIVNEFEQGATSVPTSNITISNLGATMNFVQTNINACIT